MKHYVLVKEVVEGKFILKIFTASAMKVTLEIIVRQLLSQEVSYLYRIKVG